MVLDRRYEHLGNSGPELLLIKVDEAEVFDQVASLEHVLELIRIIIILQKYSFEDLLVIHGRLLGHNFLKFIILDFLHQILWQAIFRKKSCRDDFEEVWSCLS